jgi:hypothetical protein
LAGDREVIARQRAIPSRRQSQTTALPKEQIMGLGDQKVRYAAGEDTAQALMLTLQTIGAVLYAS